MLQKYDQGYLKKCFFFYMHFVAPLRNSFPTKKVDVCQLQRRVLELFISYHRTVVAERQKRSILAQIEFH